MSLEYLEREMQIYRSSPLTHHRINYNMNTTSRTQDCDSDGSVHFDSFLDVIMKVTNTFATGQVSITPITLL